MKTIIDDTQDPEISIKEEMLGFVVVSFNDFIQNSSLTTIRKKFPIFNETILLKYPNVWWPDILEKEIIGNNTEEIERIRKEREPIVKEETGTGKEVKGKDVKKGGKAEVKGRGAGVKGKDVKVVEEVPKVVELNWVEDGRDVVAVKGDYLGRKEFEKDLKFFVAGKPVLAVQVQFG